MSASQFTTISHTIPASHLREYPNASQACIPQETPLLLSANQYIPVSDPPGSTAAVANTSKNTSVTILAATALGVPKECYEPLFGALLNLSR